MMLPRRQFLYLSAGAAALSGPFSALAQSSDTTPQPTDAERAAMSDLARAFMEKYAVPGFSIAVGHGGTILYQDAFGLGRSGKKGGGHAPPSFPHRQRDQDDHLGGNLLAHRIGAPQADRHGFRAKCRYRNRLRAAAIQSRSGPDHHRAPAHAYRRRLAQ